MKLFSTKIVCFFQPIPCGQKCRCWGRCDWSARMKWTEIKIFQGLQLYWRACSSHTKSKIFGKLAHITLHYHTGQATTLSVNNNTINASGCWLNRWVINARRMHIRVVVVCYQSTDGFRGLYGKMNIPDDFAPISKGFQLWNWLKTLSFMSYSFITSI